MTGFEQKQREREKAMKKMVIMSRGKKDIKG